MKLFHQCLVFGVAALGLASCSQEAPWSVSGNGEGSIQLNLYATGDLNRKSPSVRAGEDAVAVPSSSEFGVTVRKLDGTYNKTFSTLADFAAESEFTVGSYEIDAFYGAPDSQGLAGESGYENSYFFGTATGVTVLEGQTTEVDLQAALANAAVSIEYTDAFKHYFTDWSTSFKSDNHEAVDFGNAETRGFIIPGNVAIVISATFQNGKSVSLNPANFNAVAKTLHKVTYNVNNGEVGDAQLSITFEGVEEIEEVIVELSDELQNAPEPTVTTAGFENDGSIDAQSGVAFGGEAKFNVLAKAGLSSAILSVESKANESSLDFLERGSIDLCAATAEEQQKILASGIKARGFFNDPETMAQLDLSGLFGNLPEGVYKFTFNVKDIYGQTCEETVLNVNIFPVNTSVTATAAAYGSTYADITLSYDGPDPTAQGANPFSFKVRGNNGVFVDAPVKSINDIPSTRGFESHPYIYRISLPEIDRKDLEVNVYFGNSSDPALETIRISWAVPSYEVELDPLATSLRFRIKDSQNIYKNVIAKKVVAFVDGAEKSVTADAAGIFTIPGFEPSSDHTLNTTLNISTASGFATENSFKTEAALPVPNGDFSQTEETINEKLRVGGEWAVNALGINRDYHTDCLMKYSEPTGGWSSINKRTFYSEAVNKNTWFKVVSTYVDGNTANVRSVAYDHNGITPSKSGGNFNTKYYCENVPEKISSRSAGELFLGNYSYEGSGTGTYDEGIAFGVRPKSLTFGYKYVPVQEDSSDKGSVVIALIASDGSVISESTEELGSKSEISDYTIELGNYPFGKKATTLRIHFRSSTKETPVTHIPTGSELNENKGLNNNDISTNAAHALSTGSVLTISDLRFNY